jgi:hypothetical protein
VHLVLLTAFFFVKFSQSKALSVQNAVPVASLSRVRKLTRTPPVIPKPKVKKPDRDGPGKTVAKVTPANQIFASPKPPSNQRPDLINSAAGALPDSHLASLPRGAELFGCYTEERNICYLVDCSGSMRPIFTKVKEKLTESVKNLEADNFFSIIFFGNDRVLEFKRGELVRATDGAKKDACEFIERGRSAGQTNATAAFERAVKIRSQGGSAPDVIYFLTDGFELTDENQQRFTYTIANLIKTFAPAAKINTIGFWPQGHDRIVLKSIARQSSGECVFIDEGL